MNVGLSGWLRSLAGRISFGPFRLTAFVFHATGLEYIYKPRFLREHAALLELDEQAIAKLPKHCHTITGAKGDPINLIFVATEHNLKRVFRAAGWKRANPASPVHVLYGLFTALFKRSYDNGPFAPLYVNIALQDLAFQQPTRKRIYGERHHLRIWRTGLVLSDGRRVWVSAAGMENGMRFGKAAPFYTHALEPNIDGERDFTVKTLEAAGARKVKSVVMVPAILASKPARNAHSSAYFTDGRAVVVEV